MTTQQIESMIERRKSDLRESEITESEYTKILQEYLEYFEATYGYKAK